MIKRVHIKNFKSLAKVVVDLEDFTILVGPNGAGKSNFVDALAFVADCLSSTIDNALIQRGGINAVRRKARGHPANFGIRIDFEFRETPGFYAFEIKAEKDASYVVKREQCKYGLGQLDVQNGVVRIPQLADDKRFNAKIGNDRLALPVIAGLARLQRVFVFLRRMRFYSLVPDHIRGPQKVDSGRQLARDGSNSAAVLKRIVREKKDDYRRICELLAELVHGVTEVDYKLLGNLETMVFKQQVKGAEPQWRFDTYNISDGTLRILGILLAVYQVPRPSLLVVEEPESTIHPAAADILVDILATARERSQVLITTHSPDLLDHREISSEQIKFVENIQGDTTISPIDPLSRDMIREKLYTVGELLREDKLEADQESQRPTADQLNLFGRMNLQ